MSQFEDWSKNIPKDFQYETIARPGEEFKFESTEVYVCFADLRESTSYQLFLEGVIAPNRTPGTQFRIDYYQIFYNAVRKSIWMRNGHKQPEEGLLAEEFLIPKVIELLGDGVMMVWEVPSTSRSANPKKGPSTRSKLADFILDVVSFAQGYFTGMVLKAQDDELDQYPQEIARLTLAFGLAAGPAIRFFFGERKMPNYVGSALNLAHRLQSGLKNGGVGVHNGFAQNVTNKFTNNLLRGTNNRVKIIGFKQVQDIWKCEDGILPVTSIRLIEPRPKWKGICLGSILPLIPDELLIRDNNGNIDIDWQENEQNDKKKDEHSSRLRLAVEMFTAWAAAKNPDRNLVQLKTIVDHMKNTECSFQTFREKGKEFHLEIAHQALLEPDGIKLLETLFEETSFNAITSREKAYRKAVINEHDDIFAAIEAGELRTAQEKMGVHLTRRLEKLLGSEIT